MIYPYLQKLEKVLSLLTGHFLIGIAIIFTLGIFKEYRLFMLLVYFKLIILIYVFIIILTTIICFKILKKHGVIDGLDLMTNEEEQSKY